MRRFVAVLAVVSGALWLSPVVQAAPRSSSAGAFVLTATSPGGAYAPTFTGNGMLGVRVPPSGQGYAAGTVPAQSELAGFYAWPTGSSKPGDNVQQRANVPTWSTLTFSENGQTFTVPGPGVSNWRQSLDLHTGIVSTTARWTAPDGRVTDLTYQVLTDRASQFVGLVRLQFTPHWSGAATVTDAIDGTADTTASPELTTQLSKGWDAPSRQDWVTIQAVGTGIQATVASQLDVSSNISATPAQTDQATDQSVGQQIGFSVADGQTYTITKYVGVESSQDTPSDTVTAARGQASSAAATGWDALLLANKAAWASLWRGWIEIRGNRTLATDVNASEFYLWSSTRAGVDWSVSPAGLSSNGYDGHIFWDAETWMYPSLLAQHPDLAAGMNNYRFARLSAAEQHASATGYAGARFPWESALDGTEQIPPPVSVNSEGLYEQHITADIALAQWQYYLATGDKNWLSARGWPVLSQAATFWASRARVGSDGKYHIDGVTGPDEENPNVNDEAYTNVGAMRTLQDAVQAARVLGVTPPANWSTIAAGLVVPVRGGIHPEFSGYGGQLVKQADVTLLQYPWGYQTSRQVSLNDINFYVPRTDPGGPSMSDAVNLIDNSALNTPGCASYVYVERSYQPFIKDTFHQFSETRTGGAFTFMTGIGGFLQEFLYGYSGMRWNPGSVGLDPSLSSQIGGIVLHDLQWRGRTFQVAIGPQRTSVMLTSGSPLPVMTPQGVRLVRRGRRHGLTMATRRPDLTRTRDAVRCGRIRASSSAAGAPALAAVDGSPATDWQPAKVHATLTAALAPLSGPVRTITLRWGRMWPPAPAPNVPPPPGPVTVLRPSSYVVQVSRNGRTWRTVARVGGRSGVLDTVHLQGGAKERFVRIRVTAASVKKLPELDELTATG